MILICFTIDPVVYILFYYDKYKIKYINIVGGLLLF